MCLGHLYVFFGKLFLWVLCPFFNLVYFFFFFFLDVELYGFPVYFGVLPLIGDIICKYFLPSIVCLFVLLIVFTFIVQKLLN